MSEWWSYGLSDFLMFSPDAYWRLVARHNAAWWPAPWLGVAAGGAVLLLAGRGTHRATRAVLVLLALAWAWVGWAFHWRGYAQIFLAAPYLAAASGVQALLLLAAALPRDAAAAGSAPRWRLAGIVLVTLALLYPLLAPLQGRPWSQAEVFGSMPEPTALATLGALAMLRGLRRWQRLLPAVLPLASLLLGAATRWLLA